MQTDFCVCVLTLLTSYPFLGYAQLQYKRIYNNGKNMRYKRFLLCPPSYTWIGYTEKCVKAIIKDDDENRNKRRLICRKFAYGDFFFPNTREDRNAVCALIENERKGFVYNERYIPIGGWNLHNNASITSLNSPFTVNENGLDVGWEHNQPNNRHQKCVAMDKDKNCILNDIMCPGRHSEVCEIRRADRCAEKENRACDGICIQITPLAESMCICAFWQRMVNGTCIDDEDECSTKNASCIQSCRDTPQSFQCICDEGFAVPYGDDSRKQICHDIDECLNRNGGCSHTCDNTYGSFICSCLPGYSLYNKTMCIGKERVIKSIYVTMSIFSFIMTIVGFVTFSKIVFMDTQTAASISVASDPKKSETKASQPSVKSSQKESRVSSAKDNEDEPNESVHSKHSKKSSNQMDDNNEGVLETPET